ncbi:MAG: hypothetical protein ACPGSD_01205 [Flavobacteriales bacterium]
MNKFHNTVFFLIFHLFFLNGFTALAQVGIGTVNIDNSAIFELKSTNKGFLVPRMTAFNRESIPSPSEGLIIYCTNCCENGSLFFYNSNRWYNTSPCPDYDFDDDGVPNSEDFDDDNDGISDIEEGKDFPTNSTTSNANFSQISGSGNNSNVQVNDVYLYNNVLTSADGTIYDLIVKVLQLRLNGNNGAKANIGVSGNKPRLSYSKFQATKNNFVKVLCKFIQDGSSTVANPEGIGVDLLSTSVSIGDIESTSPPSGNQGNASEIGGVGFARKVDGTVIPIDRTLKNAGSNSWIVFDQIFTGGNPNGINSSYNLMTVDKAYSTPNDSWLGEGKISSSNNIGTGTFYYNEFSSVEIVFGYTGTATNLQGRATVLEIGTTADVNTITTSNTDYVNYDSDGDGCFDAFEATGVSINSNQVNEIGQLIGPVNADGIPSLISSTQNQGQSKNAANSNACP